MKGIIKKLCLALLIGAAMFTCFNTDVVEAKAKKHTVLFMYGANRNLQQVKHGKDAVVPTDVIVPGFTFLGWSDSASNITCDKIIIGMYLPNQVIAPVAVKKSNVPKISDKTSAPGEPWWDYTLKGVPGKTCVLRWYNGNNGELWKIEMVPYGTTLADPEPPCLDHYEFVGWEGSWENITEDRNIMAAYYHTNRVSYRNKLNQEFDVRWVRDHMSAPTKGLNKPWHGNNCEMYDYEIKGDNEDVTQDIVLWAEEKTQ